MVKSSNKRTTVIFTVLFVILLLIGLVFLSPHLIIYFLFEKINDWLGTQIPLNKNLIIAFSIPFALGVYFLIRNLLSVKRNRRWTAIFISCALLCGLYISFFFIQRNQAINPAGEFNFKFVILQDNTLKKVLPTYTIDPETMLQAIEPNPVLIYRYNIQENKAKPGKVARLTPNLDTRFFDPHGNPLVWYYERADGRLEFFDYPGRHPQIPNVTLQPVTFGVVEKLDSFLRNGMYDMIVVEQESQSTYFKEDLLKLYNPGDGIKGATRAIENIISNADTAEIDTVLLNR